MTKHHDPLDELRRLDPFAAGPGDSIEQQEARAALFEEVTMSTTTPVEKRFRAAAPPAGGAFWRKPRIAIPATAAAVAVIVGVVFAFSAITAPSALAAVTAATERTEEFTSGVADLTIEIIEAEGAPEDGLTMQTEYRYDGDDYAFATQISGEFGSFETRRVDGVEYIRFEDDAWLRADPETDPAPDFAMRDALGFGTDSVDPAGILELVEAADDIDEIESDNGETTYRGTIQTDRLIALGSERLPMGISAVLSGLSPRDELPESLVVTLVITDDLLTAAALDMDGQTPAAGYLKAAVRVTYRELGVPQSIEAPPADQVSDLPTFGNEDLAEAIAVLEEVNTRRPGLCEEIAEDAFGDDPEDFDPQLFEAFVDATVQCFTDAGEPQAADAFRSIMGDVTAGGE